ncbi:hypothetical protein CLOM_g1026 [Closterium sp. NIES-68]|nr:hypothetical protein CLOM_g1026 [Closterium sp. NIES-68]
MLHGTLPPAAVLPAGAAGEDGVGCTADLTVAGLMMWYRTRWLTWQQQWWYGRHRLIPVASTCIRGSPAAEAAVLGRLIEAVLGRLIEAGWLLALLWLPLGGGGGGSMWDWPGGHCII